MVRGGGPGLPWQGFRRTAPPDVLDTIGARCQGERSLPHRALQWEKMGAASPFEVLRVGPGGPWLFPPEEVAVMRKVAACLPSSLAREPEWHWSWGPRGKAEGGVGFGAPSWED